MELVLKRKLNLKKYVVIAETARFKEREDIVSVLKLAKEKGGKVSSTQICKELLGGKPERVGDRIILRCAELELLDRNGELTNRGIIALQENRIPEPERAIYTIWYAEDPIVSIEEKIIAIEQSRVSSKDELFSENAEEYKKLIDLPTKLIENPDKYENLILRGEKAKILKIESRGKELKIPLKEQTYVNWQVKQFDDPKLLLEGFVDQKLKSPDVSFSDIFRAVLGRDIRNWNDAYSHYKVDFESITEQEANTFQSVREFKDPVVGDSGKFNSLKISLRIAPRTLDDANKWANWLQKTNLTKYLTKEQFKGYQNKIISKFLEHDVELLSHSKLISLLYTEKNKEPKLNRNYWFLQASADLVLEGD